MVGIGFPLGQAMKKSQEAGTMASRGQADAAWRELLGAINYLAGAALALNGRRATERAAPDREAPVDDDSLTRQIGELGNQIHNLGCEYQSDEDLSERLGELRAAAWQLARSATERAATAPQAPSAATDIPQPQAPSLRRGYERTPL